MRISKTLLIFGFINALMTLIPLEASANFRNLISNNLTHSRQNDENWDGQFLFVDFVKNKRRNTMSYLIENEFTVRRKTSDYSIRFTSSGTQMNLALLCSGKIIDGQLYIYFVKDDSEEGVENYIPYKRGELLGILIKKQIGKRIIYQFKEKAYKFYALSVKPGMPIYFKREK